MKKNRFALIALGFFLILLSPLITVVNAEATNQTPNTTIPFFEQGQALVASLSPFQVQAIIGLVVVLFLLWRVQMFSDLVETIAPVGMIIVIALIALVLVGVIK